MDVNTWTQNSRSLLAEIDTLLTDVKRKVHYDRSFDQTELCRHISDELACSTSAASHPDIDITMYPSRLARFCKNIDHFLEREITQISTSEKQTAASRPPMLRRRGQIYGATNKLTTTPAL